MTTLDELRRANLQEQRRSAERLAAREAAAAPAEPAQPQNGATAPAAPPVEQPVVAAREPAPVAKPPVVAVYAAPATEAPPPAAEPVMAKEPAPAAVTPVASVPPPAIVAPPVGAPLAASTAPRPEPPPAVRAAPSPPTEISAAAPAERHSTADYTEPVSGPIPAASEAPAGEFVESVRDRLSKRVIYRTGVKATVDMPPELFWRLKRYCHDHNNLTVRQAFLDLMIAYLDHEGY